MKQRSLASQGMFEKYLFNGMKMATNGLRFASTSRR